MTASCRKVIEFREAAACRQEATPGRGGRQLEKGKTEIIAYREVAASLRKVGQWSQSTVQGGGRQAATHGGGGRQLKKDRTEVIEYREAATRQRLVEEVAAS